MNDNKNLGHDIFANAIGGILVLVFSSIMGQKTRVLIAQIVLILAIIVTNVLFHNYKCKKCTRKIKIADSTMIGEGSTTSILEKCKKDFYFMGIAANKWIKNASNFDKVMKRISAKNGEVRFILLNPFSEDAKKVSIAGGNPENHIRDIIIDNIKALQPYKKMGLNIKVKVYSHMPVFRIAIVDIDKIVYVGSYKTGSDGKDIPQIILDQDTDNERAEYLLREQFLDYFGVEWREESLYEIDIEKIDDLEYQKTIPR